VTTPNQEMASASVQLDRGPLATELDPQHDDTVPRVWGRIPFMSENIIDGATEGTRNLHTRGAAPGSESPCPALTTGLKIDCEGAQVCAEAHSVMISKESDWFPQQAAETKPLWQTYLQEELGSDHGDDAAADGREDVTTGSNSSSSASRPPSRELFPDRSNAARRDVVAKTTGSRVERRVGSARFKVPESPSAGRDRYLYYFRVHELSGGLVIGGTSPDYTLSCDWSADRRVGRSEHTGHAATAGKDASSTPGAPPSSEKLKSQKQKPAPGGRENPPEASKRSRPPTSDRDSGVTGSHSSDLLREPSRPSTQEESSTNGSGGEAELGSGWLFSSLTDRAYINGLALLSCQSPQARALARNQDGADVRRRQVGAGDELMLDFDEAHGRLLVLLLPRARDHRSCAVDGANTSGYSCADASGGAVGGAEHEGGGAAGGGRRRAAGYLGWGWDGKGGGGEDVGSCRERCYERPAGWVLLGGELSALI